MQHLASWIDRQIGALASSLGWLCSSAAARLTPISRDDSGDRIAAVRINFVYLAVVGAADFIVAREFDFTFFYLLGCAVAGWTLGLRAALCAALLAAVCSWVANSAGDAAVSNGVLIWNAAIELLGFVVMGSLAAEVGRLTRGLDQTVQERTRSLQQEMEEHKQTSLRLRDALQLFRQVAENITEVFWVTDASRSRFSYVSPEFEKVWGQPRKNVYVSASVWLDAVHPEDRKRMVQAAERMAEGYDEEFRVIRPDLSVRWVHERAFPVRDEQGAVYRVVGISEDVTARVRLERQILEISDREQARIGQDIHDSLCQKLISLAFDVDALRVAMMKEGRWDLEKVERVSGLLDDAITESRQLARGLYPVRLEAEGLVSALAELAQGMSERFGIKCSLSCPEEVVCEAARATHLYRIAQEAVNNSVKHSGAKAIGITLTESAEELELRIEDDGAGIPDPVPRVSGGMGLSTMSYRARTLGGLLHVERAGAAGTVVWCRIPIRNSTPQLLETGRQPLPYDFNLAG